MHSELLSASPAVFFVHRCNIFWQSILTNSRKNTSTASQDGWSLVVALKLWRPFRRPLNRHRFENHNQVLTWQPEGQGLLRRRLVSATDLGLDCQGANPSMKSVATIISISLFYLGAINTLLARFAGTCTQGDAARLSGIVITAILFFAALVTLSVSRRQRFVLLAISPVLLVLVWQAFFSLRLGYSLLWQGAAACQVLVGIPYPPDGGEVFYGIAWPAVSLATLAALIEICRRRVSEQSAS